MEVMTCHARGKTVKSTWVDHLRVRNGRPLVPARGVTIKVNTYGCEDVSAGAPPIDIIRAIVSLAATTGGRRRLSVHNAHVAYFLADIDEWIVVLPLRGCGSQASSGN